MVSLATLDKTINIVDAAAKVVNAGSVLKGVGTAAGTLARTNKAGGAITAVTNQGHILSRMFVDQGALDEVVMPNLTKSFHEWYAAQCIAALQLTQFISDKRTVASMLSVIQSGQSHHDKALLGNLASRTAGIESFAANYLGEAALESSFGPKEPPSYKKLRDEIATKDGMIDDLTKDSATLQDALGAKHTATSVSSRKVSENNLGPMGELFEVTVTNPVNKELSIKVPIFIQMQPSIIPIDIAPRFIDMNVAPSLWQRWTQMNAGELTFWKDFVFGADIHRRNKSFLKDPRNAAAFSDFLTTVAKKDQYALADGLTKSVSGQSANLANSVMVFTEDTVMQAKADSHIDLHNVADRKRYFKDSYTMIIAILDTLHQRVTVYFNGIDGSINCSYNDFRPKDKKFDPQDFMAALSAFSSNQIGRLR